MKSAIDGTALTNEDPGAQIHSPSLSHGEASQGSKPGQSSPTSLIQAVCVPRPGRAGWGAACSFPAAVPCRTNPPCGHLGLAEHSHLFPNVTEAGNSSGCWRPLDIWQVLVALLPVILPGDGEGPAYDSPPCSFRRERRSESNSLSLSAPLPPRATSFLLSFLSAFRSPEKLSFM